MEDLWSLTNFFGFATETFVLAVNILDRFLALMKVLWGGGRGPAAVSLGAQRFCLKFPDSKREKSCELGEDCAYLIVLYY